MPTSLAWRRSATAAGIYGSAVFGFLGSVVAFRSLGPERFGALAIVLAAAGFFQLLLDLSTEDAVVKYGFRYSTQEEWGKLRRLLRAATQVKAAGALAAAGIVSALAPLGDRIFDTRGLTTPLLLSALLPLAQAPYGVAAAAILLRGRYDIRGMLQGLGMLLRFGGMAVGSQYGITETVAALVVAQVLASGATVAVAAAAIRRFPRAARVPIGEDRPELLRFVGFSTLGTAIDSMRGMLAPLVLGVVANPTQVGYFRAAQAPQYGFAALSAPVRLILLTEQTRDFERGDLDRLESGLRRYTLAAVGAMAAVVPVALWLMPDLLRLAYGAKAVPATDAARLILLAAALQVVLGWTKSFPISIGRPNLRILAGGVELLVLVPTMLLFGAAWQATGAGAAVLASVGAFALTWVGIVAHLRRERAARRKDAAR